MKQLLLIGLISFWGHAYAMTAPTPTVTTDSAAYVADSVFTYYDDGMYSTITPVSVSIGDTALCSIIRITEMKDYGTQPYGSGWTQSGAVFFTIESASGATKHALSISINNITDKQTYAAWKAYGFKFLAWKIADTYNLNLL
jgi:hypothetical protein